MILNILVLLMTASVLHYLNIKLMSKTCYYHGMCVLKNIQTLRTISDTYATIHSIAWYCIYCSDSMVKQSSVLECLQ